MKLTKDKVFHGAQKPFPTLILQDYVLWLRYFKLDNPPTPRAREPKLLVWPLKGIFFFELVLSVDAKHEIQRRAIRKGPKNTAVWYLVTSLFPAQRL